MSETAHEEERPPSVAHARAWFFVPLVVFLALASLFYVRLDKDSSFVPSALVDGPVPDFALPPITEGGPGLSTADLQDGVHLVNVWASWCAPCRVEHPLLMQLSKDPRLSIAGINQKDEPVNATRFLGELGNPYDLTGADRRGRASIEWGVYGIPETFIVVDGIVTTKHVGPLAPADLKGRFGRVLAAALGNSTAVRPRPTALSPSAERRGRASIAWSVYGAPKTLIVVDGIVASRPIRPLVPESHAQE